MSAFLDMLDKLSDLVLSCQDVYDSIDFGSMPSNDSLVFAPSAGVSENVALDLSGDLNLDIVCNAKHKYQRQAIDALADIHHYLPRLKNLPHTDDWQILSISTSSSPTFIEFDGDQYLYGSGLEVHVYIK